MVLGTSPISISLMTNRQCILIVTYTHSVNIIEIKFYIYFTNCNLFAFYMALRRFIVPNCITIFTIFILAIKANFPELVSYVCVTPKYVKIILRNGQDCLWRE